MKKVNVLLVVLALAPLLFAGCGPRTSITSSWVNQKQSAEIKTVLVIALGKAETSRRLWENSFADLLTAENLTAVTSHSISETPVAPKKEAILHLIERAQADTVIITHLIDHKTTTDWLPGTIHYEPTAFYGGMYSYYDTAYRAVYSPPTTVEHTVVRLESNMYDVSTEALLWAAQSATTDPRLLRTDFDSVVKALIQDMKRKDILR